MTILIIVGIIVLLGIIFASMYNSLVRLRNNRENAFADIDVQLKQRHDLIPQLVDTVTCLNHPFEGIFFVCATTLFRNWWIP